MRVPAPAELADRIARATSARIDDDNRPTTPS
jgi:hypothetical protein